MGGKHTPGPWFAAQNEHYWQIDSDTHGQIGDVCASNYIYVDGALLPRHDADAIAAANARLIAAAPDLLEALIAIQDANRKGMTGEQARAAWRLVRAALRKAGA